MICILRPLSCQHTLSHTCTLSLPLALLVCSTIYYERKYCATHFALFVWMPTQHSKYRHTRQRKNWTSNAIYSSILVCQLNFVCGGENNSFFQCSKQFWKTMFSLFQTIWISFRDIVYRNKWMKIAVNESLHWFMIDKEFVQKKTYFRGESLDTRKTKLKEKERSACFFSLPLQLHRLYRQVYGESFLGYVCLYIYRAENRQNCIVITH